MTRVFNLISDFLRCVLVLAIGAIFIPVQMLVELVVDLLLAGVSNQTNVIKPEDYEP